MSIAALEVKILNDVSEVTLADLKTRGADAGDIERFQQLTGQADHNSIGQGVISYVGELKTEMDAARKDISEAISLNATDPAALLDTQLAIMRITLQEDLMAKTVGRANQSVDTLLKTQ